MTDAQLTAIFTSILDILDILDSMAIDNVKHAEVRIIREHVVAAAETTKPVPFGGSGSVSV